ncbi:MAG: hypothetical protein WDZ48_00870 [Pirellulales bacterium]
MAAERLGVHVIGPRYGESIIVELPDGSLGIIDSFSVRKRKSQIHKLIGTRFPGRKVAFFAITHPHADHLMGSADLVEEYGPEEFWVFLPFPQGQVIKWFNLLCELRTADAIEVAMNLPSGTTALEILRLNRRFNELRQRNARARYLVRSNSFTMCTGSVRVSMLTPTHTAAYDYCSKLALAEQRINLNNIGLGEIVDSIDHNAISGGVLVEFGETRVLLMADAEHQLWEQLLADEDAILDRRVHLIKVAHHGSENGYCRQLYERIADPRSTIAVVTPFDKGVKKLPTSIGISSIRPHVNAIYCTNRTVAQEATGFTWNALPNTATGVLGAIPRHWAAMCQLNPSLTTLLEAAVGGVENVPIGAPTHVPKRWARDCQENHRLLQLIRPEFRNAEVEPSREDCCDEFRVSFYFDDRGRQDADYFGWGAGKLQ